MAPGVCCFGYFAPLQDVPARMQFRPQSIAFTLLLGALAGLPALSIDMGLPALPLLEGSLRATPDAAALTLSFFMLGFGLVQIGLGPLSDRVGRRPVLLVALAVYMLAGVAAATAPSMRVLLAARLLQGAGAAGGPVMAFAIIRDLFEGPAARARLATVSLVFSLAPVIAPTLGGWMLLLGGWRAIYGLLALTGAALVLAALVGLRESRRRAPPHPHVAILRQGSTVAYALIGGLHQGCVFAFVAGSPLVLLGSMQLSTQVFGAVFGLITLGILAGAATNGVLVRRGVASAVPLGGGLLLAAAAGGLGILLDRWGMLDLYTLTPLMAVITFSRGLVSPNITHAALERVPHMAGAGASLIGSLQMLNGALAGWIVGLMFTVFGPVGMCMTMAAFAVPALLGWVGIARSRYAV